MSYKLILNPDYVNPNDGEVFDSYLINSGGWIMEYALIQNEQGRHISTSYAAEVSLGYGSEMLRDFVVTPDGTLHAYSGTSQPVLHSFNLQQDYGQESIKTYPNWSTADNSSSGGIDYYQNYVFVTDMKTSETDKQGIIRFSQTDEPAVRFAERGNFIDLTVGLDNLVYGLEADGKVSVYDPDTLVLVRSLTLEDSSNDYRAIAVNQQGEIFSAAWNGNIYYLSSQGNIVDVNEANGYYFDSNNFNDINISPDGKELIAADNRGLIAFLKIEPGRLELDDLQPSGGNSAFVSFGSKSRVNSANNLVNANIEPVVSISDAKVFESSEFAPAYLNFIVSLNQAVDETVEVGLHSFIPWGEEYDHHRQSFADNDVDMRGEVITFAPGETKKVFSLEVFDDREIENNEQIYVEIGEVISNNVEIGDRLGIGTIIDDDFVPTVSISDAEIIEGDYRDFDNAPPMMEFTVSLDTPAYRPVSVDLSMVDYPLMAINKPAQMYQDFYPVDNWRNLTFEPGETEKTITFEIDPDKEFEPTEQFALEITQAYGATVDDGLAIGTIIDDDSSKIVNPPVEIFISDAEVFESNQFRPAYLDFTIALSEAVDEIVKVDVGRFIPWGEEYNNHRQNLADYNDADMIREMLSFAPGETEKVFSLEVYDDWEAENDEQVYVEIWNVSSNNVAISDRIGIGTILDDDFMPTVSISDATILEGDYEDFNAPHVMQFNVSLDAPAYQPVEVNIDRVRYSVAAINNPADMYQDFYLMNDWRNLLFEPGETQKTIEVEIDPDNEFEPTEQFALEITHAYGATVGDGLGIGTIIDDDFKPVVAISDAEVLEGDGNESTWLEFAVSLSGVSDEVVEVDVQSFMPQSPAFSNSSNADYNDVNFKKEILSFAPGETVKTFAVEVLPDYELEADEQIQAEVAHVYSNNATIDNRPAIGTILDDESRKPQLSISDATAIEGERLKFEIELNRPAENQFSISLNTTKANQHEEYTTSLANNEDYWVSAAWWNFHPGETKKTFEVKTNQDFSREGDEYLAVEMLANSEDIVITDHLAIGRIADNDIVIGEVGYAEDVTDSIRQIQFQNEYVNPVVIVSPLTRNGGDPAIARITDIQTDGFSVFVQEPTLLRKKAHSGAHTRENFSYMVVEAGTWTMPDGSVLEAGLTDIDTSTRARNWDRLELESDFNEPVIISSVQTYNNEELLRLRQRNGDESGIDLALEKEEALLKTSYQSETVGYITVESSQHNLLSEGLSEGINLAAGETGRTVNHRWQQLDKLHNYPYVFASTNSYYGGDSVGLRYQMGSIMLDEDTSRDYEVAHTIEDVAYLGFDNLGMITAEFL